MKSILQLIDENLQSNLNLEQFLEFDFRPYLQGGWPLPNTLKAQIEEKDHRYFLRGQFLEVVESCCGDIGCAEPLIRSFYLPIEKRMNHVR